MLKRRNNSLTETYSLKFVPAQLKVLDEKEVVTGNNSSKATISDGKGEEISS